MFGLPDLILLLLLPLFGGVLLALMPRYATRGHRFLAITITAVVFGFSLLVLGQYDIQLGGIQMAQSVPWNPRLGTSFAVGVDGLALAMVVLAAFLCLITVLASSRIQYKAKAYYLNIFALEAAMIGVFIARDWTLFYVFWEMTLIPLFILIARWGGDNKHSAALNFVLYTLGGSVFLLIGLLLIFDHTPSHTFAMGAMTTGAQALPLSAQIWIFASLLIGFGVKMPLFPLHGWLPMAHVEAPAPISILLSGVLLKMGAYGLLRSAEMLPLAVGYWQPALAVLGGIGLIYGGLLAWRQADLKAMVAYSSVSHMGVVILGIATLNHVGLMGATIQMVAHGLVAGALFLIVGILYERTGSRDINEYGKLLGIAPRIVFFTTLAMVSAVGFPGTLGFIAELHTLIGAYQRWGLWSGVLAFGVLISAVYALRTIACLTSGTVPEKMQGIADLQRSELLAVVLLAIPIIGLGIFPGALLALLDSSVSLMIEVLPQ